MLKRTIILMSMVLVAPAIAQQRGWYILNFSDGQCHKAAEHPNILTPEALHQSLRREGVTNNVEVAKDGNGNILFVAVTWSEQGFPINLLWFPNAIRCDLGRKIMAARGKTLNADNLN